MIDCDIKVIARAALAEFGVRAAEIMEKRARDHMVANEPEAAETWRRVAAAVRALIAGR